MILGMTPFTFVHVLLSLLGIFSGFVVVFAFLTNKLLDGWNKLFLVTTILTSITGFLFPFHRFLPSHILGIVSMVALVLALLALYGRRLAGPWRSIYAISAVLALYLNVFVLIVQLFEKVPALKAIAPTQAAPPFLVAQLTCLLPFIILGIVSALKFRNHSAPAAS